MADWEFTLEDLEENGEDDGRDPVEPGAPRLENALFVALGVLLAVGTVVGLVVL